MSEIEIAQLKTIACLVLDFIVGMEGYTTIIVKVEEDNTMIPVTVPFNYKIECKKGDKGLLVYEEAIAGKTVWWDKNEQKYYPHNYTAYYYKHFLPNTDSVGMGDTLYIE